jgi:hypothetical protein
MTIFSFQCPKSGPQFVVRSLSDSLPQNRHHENQKWLEWLLFGQLDQPFFFDLQVPLGLLLKQLLPEPQLLFLVVHLFLVLLLLEEVRPFHLVQLGLELFDQ